jgi:hypothetical protein
MSLPAEETSQALGDAESSMQAAPGLGFGLALGILFRAESHLAADF